MYIKKTSVGERLREERERLGMSQPVMAAHGGVRPLTQYNYEKNSSNPNTDYLGKLAELGLDVLYVVTGQHTPNARGLVPETVLDRQEEALIGHFRASNKDGKRVIMGTANLAAQPKAA